MDRITLSTDEYQGSLLMALTLRRLRMSGPGEGPKKPVPEIVPPKEDAPAPNKVPEMPAPSRTPESEKPAGGNEVGPDTMAPGPEMPALPDMPEVGVPARDLH